MARQEKGADVVVGVDFGMTCSGEGYMHPFSDIV